MIAASSSSGGRCPLSCERLPAIVARAGESEHPPALEYGHLADDVRRRAEPVEPEPLGVARHRERPVADKTCAQERRDLVVGVPLR
jgi:hypothetical protein